MTCANCVATVERNVKKLEGVEDTSVNLVTEKATVTYDPELQDLEKITQRVIRAGYGIATNEIVLLVPRLTDAGETIKVEKKLKQMEGVRSASVNLSTSRILISYIPTIVSREEIEKELKTLWLEF